MSGIAVVYNRVDPSIDLALLERVVKDLAWRGPDQAGTWHDDHVGLGATQLWTTTEDWGSRQPVVGHDARSVLAFDGRLDNRPELQAELGLAAGGKETPSDADLALAAYGRWRESFPQQLMGPFSVAVWDRAQHRLVCARDPIGQRPFYYHMSRGCFYAASTIEALRRVPGVSATLNNDYIWDFLCTGGMAGSLDPEETPFTDVRRLPPGHTLVVTRNGLRLERYWEPWSLPPLRYRDDREYAEHFRELFTEVVRAHSRAAGPVCATLSGGLDSSSIVCVIRQLERSGRLTGEPLQTLTLAWEDAAGYRAGYDERQYVDEVVAQYPGPAHYLREQRLDTFDASADTTPPRDEPFSLVGPLWSALADKTHALGSRVLVAGSGGDHLLTGNRFAITDLLRRGALGELAEQLRDLAHRQGLPYPALVAGYLISPHLPRHLGAALLAALTKDTDRRRIDSLYYWRVPDWVQDRSSHKQRGRQRHKLLRRQFSSLAAQKDYEQLGVGSQDHRLVSLPNVALASGVDLRNPFFDTRLVNYCLRLPADLKYRDGITKVALRLALQDILPPQIANRRGKTAYTFAATDYVKRNWASIQDTYRQSEAQRRGYVNASLLLDEIAQLQQGGSGALDLPSLLAAIGLEDWLRRVERSPVRETCGQHSTVINTDRDPTSMKGGDNRA
ncbi:MAG: asparagine synthase-related protein [Actinomycetota bacterium]